MRWRDLESDDAPKRWIGLELRLDPETYGARQPGLQMQAGRPRLMRMMAGEWPLLWARIDDGHYGYWYLRRRLAERTPGLVVPPMTTAEARAVAAPAGSPVWLRTWCRTFARKLVDSPVSPLYIGCWWLMPAKVQARHPDWLVTGVGPMSLPSMASLDQLATQPAADYVEWDFGDVLAPLALRSMGAPDDARVKAWRRAFRDGCLPPVLLLWMSGLDRYVVLDGHDRIAAALAEGTLPEVIALCHMQESARVPDARSRAVAEEIAYRAEASRGAELRPNRPFRRETLNRLLIDAFDDGPARAPVSRAWPLAGGAARWRAQVANALRDDDDDDVRHGLLPPDTSATS
jgi:hypothetical protein